MNEHDHPNEICRSIFKNGGIQTTARDYTKAWISLINQLEKQRAVLQGCKNDRTD